MGGESREMVVCVCEEVVLSTVVSKVRNELSASRTWNGFVSRCYS